LYIYFHSDGKELVGVPDAHGSTARPNGDWVAFDGEPFPPHRSVSAWSGDLGRNGARTTASPAASRMPPSKSLQAFSSARLKPSSNFSRPPFEVFVDGASGGSTNRRPQPFSDESHTCMRMRPRTPHFPRAVGVVAARFPLHRPGDDRGHQFR